MENNVPGTCASWPGGAPPEGINVLEQSYESTQIIEDAKRKRKTYETESGFIGKVRNPLPYEVRNPIVGAQCGVDGQDMVGSIRSEYRKYNEKINELRYKTITDEFDNYARRSRKNEKLDENVVELQ